MMTCNHLAADDLALLQDDMPLAKGNTPSHSQPKLVTKSHAHSNINLFGAGDLALLQHDKPLAKGNSAPHLKHIPAYLRDPTIATPSFPGNAGKGTAPCGFTCVLLMPLLHCMLSHSPLSQAMLGMSLSTLLHVRTISFVHLLQCMSPTMLHHPFHGTIGYGVGPTSFHLHTSLTCKCHAPAQQT